MTGYPISPFAGMVLTASIATGFPRRSLARDSQYLLNTHSPRPILDGVEKLPPAGAFTLISNHYQRQGLWIGWIGAMIADALYAQRGSDPPIRIITTDSQRFRWRERSYRVPFSRWFFRRVAAFWGMIPLPADERDQAGRAAALRRALRCLRDGEPILLFPEGEAGRAESLTDALPGTGTFLALASRYAPVIPAAFWEEGDLLRGRIGRAFTLPNDDDSTVRRAAMAAIAALLVRSHGGYIG